MSRKLESLLADLQWKHSALKFCSSWSAALLPASKTCSQEVGIKRDSNLTSLHCAAVAGDQLCVGLPDDVDSFCVISVFLSVLLQ